MNLNQKRNHFRTSLLRMVCPTINITAIKEDDKNNLWISTAKGLCCFNPDTKMYRNFFRGMELPMTNSLDAACNLQNGNLAFGGYNGFVVASSR